MRSNERYISQGSLRTLIEGCDLDKQPALLEELRRQFQLTYPILPEQYSFSLYLTMLDWLRQQLYPHETEAAGYEKIGRHITQGMFDGAVGHLLKLSAELLGVQRGVSLFYKVLGGALPFGKVQQLEQRPGYVRFMLWNVPGTPEITRGMILEALDAAKVKKSEISYHKPTDNDTEFEVSWQD